MHFACSECFRVPSQLKIPPKIVRKSATITTAASLSSLVSISQYLTALIPKVKKSTTEKVCHACRTLAKSAKQLKPDPADEITTRRYY